MLKIGIDIVLSIIWLKRHTKILRAGAGFHLRLFYKAEKEANRRAQVAKIAKTRKKQD